MKKLSFVKVLGVFSIFYSSSISFAGSSPLAKGAQAMSSLMGHIDQQNVNNFRARIQGIARNLESELKRCDGKGKIQLEIAYLKGLVEIADEVLEYQRNQTQQLWNKLEAIARTYGGEVHELIWSLPLPPAPAPAPAPPVPPPPVHPQSIPHAP
jgi:hypothetical protein